jgi:hypothetical protein
MDQSPQTPPPDPPPAEPTEPTRDEDGRFRPGVVQPGAKLFKPGQSGNKGGSSQKQRLTSELKRLLDEKEGLPAALMSMAVGRALKGDFRFFKEILERIDGKVTDKTEVKVVNPPPQRTPQEILQALREAHGHTVPEKPKATDGSGEQPAPS